MKKAVCALLALLMCCAAFAEPPVPPQSNPEEYYEFLMEESDGSEQLLYMLLDSANDELSDVETYGALIMEDYVLQYGVFMHMTLYITNTPLGVGIVTVLEGSDDMYVITDSGIYYTEDGEFSSKVLMATDVGSYITGYHFPFASLKLLKGMREEENFIFMLIESDDEAELEFVITNAPDESLGASYGMRIVQTRYYMKDASGNMVLGEYLNYSTGAAPVIPESLLSEMQKDAGAQQNDKAGSSSAA